jgi:hypothetical protein
VRAKIEIKIKMKVEGVDNRWARASKPADPRPGCQESEIEEGKSGINHHHK